MKWGFKHEMDTKEREELQYEHSRGRLGVVNRHAYRE